MDKIDRILNKAVPIFIIVAVLLAGAELVFDNLLPEKWFTMGVFGVLFCIFHFCSEIPNMNSKFNKIEQKLAMSGFQTFESYKGFYDSLSSAITNAKVELLLTHVRQQTPTQFKTDRDYFGLVERWADEHPEGLVKRIGALSNSEMNEWCMQQFEYSEKYQNFYFRALTWTHAFSHINMAIIDKKDVYIAISGETTEETSGLYVADPKVAEYFIKYFQNMWVEGHTKERAQQVVRGNG